MQGEVNSKPVPEAPTDNDRTWFTAAIVTFTFAVIAFVFAAFWIFAREGPDAVHRAQSFQPFGVAIAAIVTFFTVVWRGVLATKQLNLQAAQLQQQIDQLSQVIRQNDAKENETLVKLLQDGAKFITEDGKKPQVMAGIASLDALISNDQKRQFSNQAMDILAAYYLENYQDENDTVRGARRALNRAADAGVVSTIHAAFTTDVDERYDWPIVRGFASQTYTGGDITKTFLAAIGSEGRKFTEVDFRFCVISLKNYTNCRFRGCEIKSFDPDDIATNSFTSCDFSGCDFDSIVSFDDLRERDLRPGKNFYYSDTPPTYEGEIAWPDILIEKPAADRKGGAAI